MSGQPTVTICWQALIPHASRQPFSELTRMTMPIQTVPSSLRMAQRHLRSGFKVASSLLRIQELQLGTGLRARP